MWSCATRAAAASAGSLRLHGGGAHVFIVDEGRQTVAVRDSGGPDWVTFRDGQVTRRRVGDRRLPRIDSVQVDAQAIRVLRQPQDDGRPANRARNPSDELMGALGDLMRVAGTSSSVAIDRSSAVIRTGGMGLFPNNASGACKPRSGRRF